MKNVDIAAFIRGLSDFKALEGVGKKLDVDQALNLLHRFSTDLKDEIGKLTPLLVGMSHEVFTEILCVAKPEGMAILRQEALSEAVQHHMSVLTHEIMRQIPSFGSELEQLQNAIKILNITDLTHRELLALTDAIQQATEFYRDTMHKCDRLLALAWNTSRLDLIDKLSHAKELCARFTQHVVGHPRSLQAASTGLYALLEKQLNSVYGNPDDPKDIEAVDDDEPALEALVKLSVWYPDDYWHMGLLPRVKDPQLLNPVPKELSPEQRQAILGKLLIRVQNNLDKMGLHTAKDLKKAEIYSREALQAFIARHTHILT